MERASGTDPIEYLDGRFLSLVTNNDIDEVFLKRLSCDQAGMPTAENDGCLRAQTSDEPARRDGVPDHRSCQKRNTKGDASVEISFDGFEIVGAKCAIDNAGLESSRSQ